MNNLHDNPALDKWSQAIKDAKLMIADHQRKILALRRAIKNFKELRAAGEKWPEKKVG